VVLTGVACGVSGLGEPLPHQPRQHGCLALVALAMKFGFGNQDLKKVLWAYPTNVSDLKYMID